MPDAERSKAHVQCQRLRKLCEWLELSDGVVLHPITLLHRKRRILNLATQPNPLQITVTGVLIVHHTACRMWKPT